MKNCIKGLQHYKGWEPPLSIVLAAWTSLLALNSDILSDEIKGMYHHHTWPPLWNLLRWAFMVNIALKTTVFQLLLWQPYLALFIAFNHFPNLKSTYYSKQQNGQACQTIVYSLVPISVLVSTAVVRHHDHDNLWVYWRLIIKSSWPSQWEHDSQ